MNRKQARAHAFTSGWLGFACFMMLFQTSMGRDAYARWVYDYWVADWLTVPVAFMGCVMAVWLWRASAEPERKSHGR